MDFTVGIISRNLANTSNSKIANTFFEASSFGCRKTTCDVTKVTYNMYSCDMSYMSREMMEIEGRGSAKCQNSGKKEHICHFGNFK